MFVLASGVFRGRVSMGGAGLLARRVSEDGVTARRAVDGDDGEELEYGEEVGVGSCVLW